MSSIKFNLWACGIIVLILSCVVTVIRTESPPDDYEPPKQESSVYVLTNDNFDDFIKYHDAVMVEFYAPWCGHCKALEPKFAKAAETLKDSKSVAVLAKVDATEQTDLASRFDVNGYPTIKMFVKGTPYDYDGMREADAIVERMKIVSLPEWTPPPADVVTLTKENFHDVVDNEDLMLVEFYAPWCGHCKQLAPKYEKAAGVLKGNNPPIILAKVDATVETDLAKEYGVTGYPTMKIFRKGRASEYKGPREQQGIIDFMRGQVGDGSKPVSSLSELKKKFSESDVTIVAFHTGDDGAGFRAYMDAANEIREDFTALFHTFDPTAARHYSLDQGAVVVFHAERFYTKHEPKWHVLPLTDAITSADVLAFIAEHQVPLVGHYSHDTAEKRYKKRPLCLVFYTVDWSYDHRQATQLWRRKIAEIAKDYLDITFAVLDDDTYQDKLKDFGLLESGEDLNIGILGEKDYKYAMEPMEEFDSDHIRSFLDDFKQGKIKRLIKSQATPQKQEGPVTVVVGNTFQKIVEDPTKDVLVMFYAPWCGHCKQLMPVFKKLAKAVQSEENVVIAKIDSTANDTPSQYSVDGFPTIYFVPSGPAAPVKYDGGRDVEAFVKFLKDKATVSFGKSATAAKDEL